MITNRPYSLEQLEVINADIDKPLLIKAGPGAGKTHVLVGRIMALMNSLNEDEWMAAITYTNAAKNELKSRLNFTKEQQAKCFIGTTHQFAKSLLESAINNNITILDEGEGLRRLAQFCDLSFTEAESLRDNFRESMPLDSELKKKHDSFLGNLKICSEATFDSLIFDASRLSQKQIDQEPKYIVVDEYQDSSQMQVSMFDKLKSYGSILNVVGDPEQAIFQSPELIKNFACNNKETSIKILYDNYRSSSDIVELSNLIRSQEDELKQNAKGDVRKGQIQFKQFTTESDQDQWLMQWINNVVERDVAFRDVAILCRLHETIDRIKRKLKSNNIPVREDDFDYMRMPLTNRFLVCLKFMQFNSYSFLFSLINVMPGLSDKLGGELRAIFSSYQLPVQTKISDDFFEFAENNISDDLKGGEWPKLKKIIEDLQEYEYTLELGEAIKKIYENVVFPSILFGERLHRHYEIVEQVVAGAITKLNTLRHIALWDRKLSEICKTIEGGNIEIDGGLRNINGIDVRTIHSSKGLEWESVAVVDVCAGIFPSEAVTEKQREQRLLHVSISRAKSNLSICSPLRVGMRQGVSDFRKHFDHLC